MRRHEGIAVAACVLGLVLLFPGPAASAQEPDDLRGPLVSDPVVPGASPAVRDLPVANEDASIGQVHHVRQNPLRHEWDQGRRGTWDRERNFFDPLLREPAANRRAAPDLIRGFDATGNPTACGGCTPPDPSSDVGPDHYVHMVNATKVAIYDKLGTLLSGPFDLGTLWPGADSCASNAGDPVVLYDPLADRWLLSQFAHPSHLCIAVSQTADPTGTYHTYTFDVGSFPDYFKLGVWPDGYYVSANEGTYTAYAFDRARMLTGAAATFQKFTGGTNLYLPSDVDGPTPPPAGAPNLFYTFKDGSFHGGSDRLELREFHVDWTTPANSTFTLAATLPIASFSYSVCGFFNLNCVKQSGTTQRLDAVSEWPMFRFPYRNFGTHQSLAGTFVVGGGLGETGAAIRWFELRKAGAGWTLHQEGTHSPADGHDRILPSIAMDRQGNLALGFTVSSSAIHPQIRYATRLAGEPLGTLQAEAVMIAPNGSQIGSNRWGDYSAMAVDPSDDCTFWYTNEYYAADSANEWRTRVGAFAIPQCLATDLTVSQTAAVTKAGRANLRTQYSITVHNQGPRLAESVMVDDPLPTGTRFVSHSTTQGTCTTPAVGAGGTVSCSLGTLASGATATITVTIRRGDLGRRDEAVLRNTVTVTAVSSELDPSDNSITLETRLLRPLGRR